MAAKVVTIDVRELEREVRAFGAEVERGRLPRPVTRIHEVIGSLQAYTRAVILAAPGDFPAGGWKDPVQRERLRAHREGHLAADRPDGVTPMRARLLKLDSAHVVGDEVWWLDEVKWEQKVWRPIRAWVERGYDLLTGDRDGDGWPWPVRDAVLDGWQQEGRLAMTDLLAMIAVFLPERGRLRLGRDDHTVYWDGRQCPLGDTLSFKLFAALLRNAGQPVSREALRRILDHDNDDYGQKAFRSALKRLKRALIDGGCADLAEAIKPAADGYLLFDPPVLDAVAADD